MVEQAVIFVADTPPVKRDVGQTIDVVNSSVVQAHEVELKEEYPKVELKEEYHEVKVVVAEEIELKQEYHEVEIVEEKGMELYGIEFAKLK